MGGRGQNLRQAVNEDANPAYRYHSTSFAAFENIKYDGLKQSANGQLGKGVYLAPDVESTKGWTNEANEQVALRVKASTLNSKYKFEDWDDQSIARSKISASDIEVKTSSGEWIPVSDAIVDWISERRGLANIRKISR